MRLIMLFVARLLQKCVLPLLFVTLQLSYVYSKSSSVNTEKNQISKILDNKNVTKNKIRVFVDNEVITQLDLDNKAKVFKKISNLKLNEKEDESFKKQIMQAAIDESLKFQVTRNFSRKFMRNKPLVTVKEIEDYLDNFLSANNIKKEDFLKFLKENKIDIKFIYKQIDSNISWIKYIQECFGGSVQISDLEATTYLNNLNESLKYKSYSLSRIVINIGSDEKAAYQRINEAKGYLNNDANFAVIANTFSQSPEAVNGGFIGIIREDQLTKEELKEISSLNEGEISEPIKVRNAYIIYKLNEIFSNGRNQIKEYTLQRIEFKNVPHEKLEETAINAINSANSNYKSFLSEVKNQKDVTVYNDEVLIYEQSPQDIKNFLSTLEENKVSIPVQTENGFFIFYVKSIKVQKLALPNINEIKNVLANKRLEAISIQKMREARSASLIKIVE